VDAPDGAIAEAQLPDILDSIPIEGVGG